MGLFIKSLDEPLYGALRAPTGEARRRIPYKNHIEFIHL
jgi:hypothetical protein